jgi:hypothetical protein
MLYYFLFEVCPCFLFFLVGGLIIHLLSIVFKSVADSLGEAHHKNSREWQKGKREESDRNNKQRLEYYGIKE